MSMRSYWNGSPFLMLASIIIAFAMHILSLQKSIATAFFIVPMLVLLINSGVAAVFLSAFLCMAPIAIVVYWVLKEGNATA